MKCISRRCAFFCSKLYLYFCVGTLALLGPFYELGLGGQGGFVPVTLRGIWGGVKVSIVHIVVQKIFNWKYDYFLIPLCETVLIESNSAESLGVQIF